MPSLKNVGRGLIATLCTALPLSAIAVDYSVPMNSSAEFNTTANTNGSTDTSIDFEGDLSLDIMLMLGADANPTYFERRLVRTFSNVGAESAVVSESIYSNASLTESAFDFRQYIRHRCFNMVNVYDSAWCKMEFGPYADLRMVLFNGTLSKILVRHEIIAADEHDLVNAVGFDVQLKEQGSTMLEGAFGGSDMADSLAVSSSRMSRSRALWKLCGDRDMDTQAACYQDNQRLIQDASLDIGTNFFFNQ